MCETRVAGFCDLWWNPLMVYLDLL
jgi:hypothetical protein